MPGTVIILTILAICLMLSLAIYANLKHKDEPKTHLPEKTKYIQAKPKKLTIRKKR
jgi:hypothetical protein